jgi:hypothetical protein
MAKDPVGYSKPGCVLTYAERTAQGWQILNAYSSAHHYLDVCCTPHAQPVVIWLIVITDRYQKAQENHDIEDSP